jgi:hypothetical protein
MLKRFLMIIAACVLLLAYVEQESVQAETAPEWEQILPDGETICGRGTPYAFYVNRGRDQRKLHIHFIGGGACWNSLNCQRSVSLFTDEVIPYEAILNDASLRQGVFDLARPENPLRDYATVLISYCTGDVHVGNRVVNYSPSLTIYHKGYVNAKAALDWVYQNFPEAEKVLVSGCSAGSYGANHARQQHFQPLSASDASVDRRFGRRRDHAAVGRLGDVGLLRESGEGAARAG